MLDGTLIRARAATSRRTGCILTRRIFGALLHPRIDQRRIQIHLPGNAGNRVAQVHVIDADKGANRANDHCDVVSRVCHGDSWVWVAMSSVPV